MFKFLRKEKEQKEQKDYREKELEALVNKYHDLAIRCISALQTEDFTISDDLEKAMNAIKEKGVDISWFAELEIEYCRKGKWRKGRIEKLNERRQELFADFLKLDIPYETVEIENWDD